MKKGVSLFLALAMLIGALPVLALADAMAPYDPPITITTAQRRVTNANFAGEHSWENTAWTPFYRDLGINVEILWSADASEYESRLNIAIASGDIPDVMRVYDPQINMMLAGDMLADLTDVFDEYASDDTKNELLASGGVYMKGAYVDGRLRYLPYEGDSHRDWAETMWIRKDWLNNVGLNVPTTMDEFLAVCDAFVNGDPNKSGKNDTFALGLAGKDNLLTDWGSLRPFFLSYDAQPGFWFSGMLFYEKDENGSVIWSGAKPGVKDALTTLNDMYNKGYIAKDFGTVDSGGRLVEDLTSGKCGIFAGAYWVASWPLPSLRENDPTADWVVIPAPTVSGAPTRMERYQPASSFTAVSKNCKNPEAIIKMLNVMTGVYYGQDGNNPEKLKVLATPGVQDAGTGIDIATVTFHSPRLAEKEFRDLSQAIAAKDPSGLNDAEMNSWEGILQYFDNPANGDAWGTYFSFCGDPGYILEVTYDEMKPERYIDNAYMGVMTDLMAEKFPIYRKMADELVTNIITGQAPVSDWDKLVADWAILGNNEVIAQIEEAQ